jgi:hypothetical protein
MVHGQRDSGSTMAPSTSPSRQLAFASTMSEYPRSGDPVSSLSSFHSFLLPILDLYETVSHDGSKTTYLVIQKLLPFIRIWSNFRIIWPTARLKYHCFDFGVSGMYYQRLNKRWCTHSVHKNLATIRLVPVKLYMLSLKLCQPKTTQYKYRKQYFVY